MRITSVQIRRFRSAAETTLLNCGGLNILIGKNNAGKSNILSAIELLMMHLRRGTVAGSWPVSRPKEEFTDRRTNSPVQIGISFALPEEQNTNLRADLITESPHLEKSIEQIRDFKSVAFVLSGATTKSEAFLYIEQLGVGSLKSDGPNLAVDGIKLLSVRENVAYELYRNQETANDLRLAAEAVADLSRSPKQLEQTLRMKGESFFLYDLNRRNVPRELARQIQRELTAANNVEEGSAILSQLFASMQERAINAQKKEATEPLSAFAGDTRVAPAYAERLMKTYGSLSMIHFRESKQQIGRDEAETLLNLKVRRGGPERLEAIQETIRGLLGVHVDAFQADQSAGEGHAEMDVDQFLVEANGAGIREALRIVLDLELKSPKLVLIEEPEVHLHPGLARLVAGYLREKSVRTQMFVTTHSTDFVDSVSFQNAYLVSRDSQRRTTCQLVEATDGIQRIPAELGLRLSTVFMFDRLLFVEGASDEAVLRELAKHLGIDLTASNVGFVQMGGVRNFAHFAAEGTLDLLSKRQIRMWFLSDRDEREDEEVQRMTTRLGDRAKLVVLEQRELENYLLDAGAVALLVSEKLKARGIKESPTEVDVSRAIDEAVDSLRNECGRLRLATRLLRPIFLNVRTASGTPRERIDVAKRELDSRLECMAGEEERIGTALEHDWARRSREIVPGALVLEKVAEKFGVQFSKSGGDSEFLARHIASVPTELKRLLTEVTD